MQNCFSPHICVGFLFLIVYPAPPPSPPLPVTHTQLCHTPSFTHNFVTHLSATHHISTHSLSHTTLSHTQLAHTHTTLSHALFHTQQCHTQLCDTLAFTHNFVTHTHAHTHKPLCHLECGIQIVDNNVDIVVAPVLALFRPSHLGPHCFLTINFSFNFW